MFSSIIVTIFFLGLTTGLPKPLCDYNEEFHACGTECPATCTTLFDPRPKMCPEVCVEGCFCKSGFVRAGAKGPCVPERACLISVEPVAPLCGRNEIFAECGSLCPLTCVDNQPRACADVCYVGCVCREGYIRSTASGPCVPKDGCKVAV